MGAIAGVIFVVCTIAMLLYGQSLSRSNHAKRTHQRIKEAFEQSNWQGTELLVKHRFVAAMFWGVLAAGVFYLLTQWGMTMLSLPDWTLKGCIAFALLAIMWFMAGLLAWAWLATTLVALIQGYSIKVDSQGVHLVGLPVLPFSAVNRVSYIIQASSDLPTDHLLIEIDAVRAQGVWRNTLRALLSGYVYLALMGWFQKNKPMPVIQIYASHWSVPVPTVAAAIRKISRIHGESIYEYSKIATLEEAVREDQLQQIIAERLATRSSDDLRMQAIFRRLKRIDSSDLAAISEAEKQLEVFEADSQQERAAHDELGEIRQRQNERERKQYQQDSAKAEKMIPIMLGVCCAVVILLTILKIA